MTRVKIYFMATRPQFFPAVLIPVALGAAAAWHTDRIFYGGYLILTLAAAVLYHAGMNVLNDYFDFHNGTDNINKNALTPFTGGARMIQTGLLSPSSTLALSIMLLLCGTLTGLYLAHIRGTLLLLIGLFGLFSGIFYSAPPFFLAGRGLGEIIVGLNFGVLTTLGSYLVQTGRLGSEPFFASLPLTFLIGGLLYINQFPDYKADKEVGKLNLVVKFGPETARWGMLVIVAAAYLSIAFATAAGLLPMICLVSIFPMIFALRGAVGLIKHYDKGNELVPFIKSVIFAHALTGILLTAALAYI